MRARKTRSDGRALVEQPGPTGTANGAYVDILRIRTFVTVARLGHVTRASEVLHVTQPAVTGHIKTMEQELGIALFRRTPGRIELTKSGEALLPHAEKVLADFSALLSHAKAIKGEVTGSLNFALVDDVEFLRIGGFLSGLRSAFPLLQLKTSNCSSEEVLERVASAECDAGFCVADAVPQELSAIKLRGVTYVVVAPTPLAEALGKAGWRDVAGMPWIAPPARSHVRQIQNAMFANQGVTPNVVVECDQLSAIEGMVRSGLGLALMREEVATSMAADGEFFIWPHVSLTTQLVFVFRASEESNPSTVGMISVLKRVWNV
ncbi:LysR family transcriptional regulator [Propionivibrio soli]|uniref:LysR family transcriptional regulator n=1 Tax=Propionivibrio soli TaxID=2976531 RepID=UPI0021E9A795|nr:LysR family transcriptional regulator [Propionivibrio soli]